MSKIRPLSENLQKAAREKLSEVPDRIPSDLETLKTWIAQQPHLRAQTDDQLLVAFLRGCKFSLERAKSKIDKFYALRSKYPELFMCTDVDEVKFREIVRLGLIFYLPTPLNDNGPRIVFMRCGHYSAEKYSTEDLIRVIYTLQEVLILDDDYAIINGIVFVLDFSEVTASHLFKLTPVLLKKMTAYSQEAVPLRPQAAHFFDTPSGFEPVFRMLKPMLAEKQQNRLFVHGSKLKLLHNKVPKKYLPKEYGGENGSIEEILDNYEKKLDQYRAHFKESLKYGTNEKLRPGKPIDFEGRFGLDGSFRKLDVD